MIIPFAKAEAKIIIVKPTDSSLPTVDGFTVHFVDPSPPTRLAIEVLDTDQDGVKQLGIYPSKYKFYYTIEAEGKWQYKVLGSDDEWSPIGARIEANKILLKLAETEDQDENTDNQTSQIVLPSYDSREEKSSSLDGKLMVDVPNSQVSITKVFAPIKNNNLHLISSFYKIDSQLSDYILEFNYNQNTDSSKAIFSYNRNSKIWERLTSYNDFPNKVVKAQINNSEPIIVAIFENDKIKDGIASFYDQSRYRTFNYANGNFAASRDYPRGTKLRVTRLLSNDSIVVEVNDYGPELSTGRIIDLDISAFEQLGSTSAGLIYVKVEPYDSNL